MNTHMRAAVQCLHLTIISAVVTGRIIPTFDFTTSDKNGNTDHQLGQAAPQTENKWQFNTFDTKQSVGDLEKLVKQSLENIFKNEQQSIGHAENVGGFGLKKTLPKGIENFDLSGAKNLEQELYLSDPEVLKIPVPQPYPVHIPVKQPFTVPIFKLVTEEVEKRIPIPVEKLVPVYKEKPVKVIVEKHHPVHVYKPYVVPVPINTHVLLGNRKEHQKWNQNSFYN